MSEILQLLSKHFNFAIIALENLLMLRYRQDGENGGDHFKRVCVVCLFKGRIVREAQNKRCINAKLRKYLHSQFCWLWWIIMLIVGKVTEATKVKVSLCFFCDANEQWAAANLIINAGNVWVGEALTSRRYILQKFKFHLLNRKERKLWFPLVTLRAVIKTLLPFSLRGNIGILKIYWL